MCQNIFVWRQPKPPPKSVQQCHVQERFYFLGERRKGNAGILRTGFNLPRIKRVKGYLETKHYLVGQGFTCYCDKQHLPLLQSQQTREIGLFLPSLWRQQLSLVHRVNFTTSPGEWVNFRLIGGLSPSNKAVKTPFNERKMGLQNFNHCQRPPRAGAEPESISS